MFMETFTLGVRIGSFFFYLLSFWGRGVWSNHVHWMSAIVRVENKKFNFMQSLYMLRYVVTDDNIFNCD